MATEQTPQEPDLRDRRRGHRDLNALFWLGGWGGAAAVALTALAITSQTETATERLRRIFAFNEPAGIAQMPPRVAQLESDVQLIAAQVRALSVERERLLGRIALLESNIDDMTGTIKKQAAATAAALAAKTAPPAPPAIAAPAASPSTPAKDIAATSTPSPAPAPKIEPSTTGAIPLPQARLAAALPTETETPAGQNQSEFGLDLGGATTIDGVRQRWISVKANFGPLLSGMHPLAAHERRPGGGYRLVVGPLPNTAAATGLCAHFAAARTACRAVKFDGEQIAQR